MILYYCYGNQIILIIIIIIDQYTHVLSFDIIIIIIINCGEHGYMHVCWTIHDIELVSGKFVSPICQFTHNYSLCIASSYIILFLLSFSM